LPDETEESASRPFWSGTISFGLVSIPVTLFAANRPSRVALHMIGPHGRQLRRRYFSQDDRELTTDEIVRGYEIKKNDFVVVTDEELDRLAPEKSRDIDLRRFVPYSDIPKLYFEHAYFLAPGGASGRAYRLLADTMEKTGQAGIATFVMRGKEYLVAIVAENGILRAETLRFFDEVRQPQDVGLPDVQHVSKTVVRRFEQLIDKHASDELPRDEMHNREADTLLDLAERKASEREDTIGSRAKKGQEHPSARPVDLVEALRRALQTQPQSRSAEANGAGEKKATSQRGLDQQSKQDLYERAKELNISGRSKMTREQLIAAIQNAA
jgi:DNA end-binding protein Ku